MKCPHCGRDFESVEDQVYCSFCGGRLDSPPESPPHAGGDHVADESDRIAVDETSFSPSRDGYCPWEDQERLGLFRAMAETVKETLLTPLDFFSRLPVRGGLISPLLYALILGTLGAMIGSLWGFLSGSPLLMQATRQANVTVLVGVFIPVVVFLAIVVSAAMLHGSLFLLGAARENFEATFRVVCYSESTQLLNIVPVIGPMAGWIWRIYILTLGLREVHRISTGKAVMGVLLPFIATCLFVFVVVSMVAVGLDPG